MPVSEVMLVVPVPPLTTSIAVTEPPVLFRLKPLPAMDLERSTPLPLNELLAIVMAPDGAFACNALALVVAVMPPVWAVIITVGP